MTHAPSKPRRRIETRVPFDEVPASLPPGERPKSVLHHLAPDVPQSQGQEGAISGQERYRVEGEIGAGGMGKVLRVADTDLNREIAMKVLNATGQATMRRFIEEAQITSQLEHPNMLPVHDFGINEEGDVFFTMQYVRSHDTLGEIIERLREGDEQAHRDYTFERRVQLIQQVCNALDYAHERGVIHRDIKPDNIMVGEYGQVYLVDWGVAKLLDQADRDVPYTLRSDDDDDDPDTTRDGVLIGTPPYMAPEQILGLNAEVDPITDVYALCVVLYELLTLNYYLGDVADELGAITSAVVHRRPLDAESYLGPLNGRVPRSLSRICRKGLSKPREARFQSARELSEALQAWLEGNAPIVCPGTLMQRGLANYSRLIDRRPVLLPAITITSAILLLGWLILTTLLVVFP